MNKKEIIKEFDEQMIEFVKNSTNTPDFKKGYLEAFSDAIFIVNEETIKEPEETNSELIKDIEERICIKRKIIEGIDNTFLKSKRESEKEFCSIRAEQIIRDIEYLQSILLKLKETE